MVCSSCAADKAAPNKNSLTWQRALCIALTINVIMFAAELVAGILGGSRALQADALDFLGDAANYAISLGVTGLALAWRARAALVKGATIFGFGLYVLLSALWALTRGTVPHAEVMGAIGFVALLANAGVALMLYRFRDGDANMRSVWICSRNNAIGNVAVLFAALGVFGTGSGLPDIIVAAIMAGLALWGGAQILRHAIDELRSSETTSEHLSFTWAGE
ncbi:cation transporter [Sphingobium sp. RSMS]|uniref:cation transporter n=1 Tax=Sphingobium sp. RSMS TaxID=520734 RepID=UPI0010F85D83|nr:cation transporter [Sphingobium sp. RSMS]UXC90279.1 cation transporter [Sphingobium sp. RSMS]